MINTRHLPLAWAILGVVLSEAAGAEPAAKSDKPGDKANVAAYVGSEPILIEDLDAKALKTNMKLAQSLYDARKAALDQVIMERALASEAGSKGVSVEKLIQERIAEKTKPVTDQDVENYFNANSARMGGRTLEQASAQIRSMLSSQQETAARQELLAQLKEKAGVRITLSPPRMEVTIAANDPTKGPPTAKVTIVEFVDYQ